VPKVLKSAIGNCQSAILLASLARDRLNSCERFLLLANAFDCVNLAQGQFEFQTEKRLPQTRCFSTQFVLTQLAILIDFFTSFHC